MNRVYNELCKVIISDIPEVAKESEDPSSSALVSRISISDTVMNEERITIMDNSNQSIQDDHCIHHSLPSFLDERYWNAIKSNNYDLVQTILVERPQFSFLWNEEGETALHLACLQNNPLLITLLLENGCSPLSRDISDRLPYHCCSTKTSRDVMRDYRGSHPDQ